MKRLVEAGLYGAGLIEVSTPELVRRYNSCLEQLGIDGTKLERFRIDCVGWSPEVAKEKGSDLYLSHGIPNQLAVILTPDQRKKPIYFPFNSFERRMVDTFFSKFEAEIADITATNAISLEIDQGLSSFETPQDLLLIDHVTLRVSTDGNLMAAANEQKLLVEKFLEEKEAWFDRNLRQAIIQDGVEHGDLRERKIEIPDMLFDDLRSFYSEAFDGVFVIRTDPGIPDLLVFQNKELLGKRPQKNVFWVQDPKLLDALVEFGILEINFPWFREHPGEINYKLECLAADALCSNDLTLNFSKLTPSQRRRMLLDIKKTMPSTYFELERVRKMLDKGVYPEMGDLSRGVKLVLFHPSGNLPAWYRTVIWQLLCRITQHDPLRLYIGHKNRFFSLFETWPDSKQAWAVEVLTRLYVPTSKRRS